MLMHTSFTTRVLHMTVPCMYVHLGDPLKVLMQVIHVNQLFHSVMETVVKVFFNKYTITKK